MIILFYQGLKKKKMKQSISLWMVEEMPYFFLGKYLYKVDIVWCDVILVCVYVVCVYTHTYRWYVYKHTHFVCDLK